MDSMNTFEYILNNWLTNLSNSEKFHHLKNMPLNVKFSKAGQIAGNEVYYKNINNSDILRFLILKDETPHNINLLFKKGSYFEQASILKLIQFIKFHELFLEISLHALRSNNKVIFESIAIQNLFPFLHFDENSFEQLVLKCIFMEINITDILGLESRLTKRLITTTNDFKQERLAANRSIPTGILQLNHILKSKGINHENI